MTRMNEVVGICLHRARFAAVFWGRRLWFADAAARGAATAFKSAVVSGDSVQRRRVAASGEAAGAGGLLRFSPGKGESVTMHGDGALQKRGLVQLCEFLRLQKSSKGRGQKAQP